MGGKTYRYAYDALGNITRIYSVNGSTNTLLHLYTYDNNSQLTADMNSVDGTITDYSYDDGGNILQVKVSSWDRNTSNPIRGTEISRNTYSYTDDEWADLLTSYNGQTITYDAIGNPLSYRDGITMTWQNGRELATYADGTNSVSYSYDASGMRTSKTVTKSSGSTTAYTYVYENGLLLQMSRGARFYDFSYDANGRPLSIAYRSQAEATPIYYYYALNSRGDVIGLYNSSGNIAALYDYDAYGKLLSVKTATGISITAETDVAIVNPLRYRGYVYDTETGFYYLQSRYYDPTTCRFINGDCQLNLDSANGFNVFAYCNGNPVFYTDNSGTRPVVGASSSNESYAERKLSFAYMNNSKIYTDIIDAVTDAGISASKKTSQDNKEHAFCTYSGSIGDTEYYFNGPMINGEHAQVNIVVAGKMKDRLAAITHSHPYCNGHIPNDFSIIDPITGQIYGDAAVSYGYGVPMFLAAPNGSFQILFWEDDKIYTGVVNYGLPVDNTKYNCIGSVIS